MGQKIAVCSYYLQCFPLIYHLQVHTNRQTLVLHRATKVDLIEYHLTLSLKV